MFRTISKLNTTPIINITENAWNKLKSIQSNSYFMFYAEGGGCNGFNYRLSDIQCALGISQIKRLKKFVRKRKKIASFYDKIFKDKQKFQIPTTHSYHLYPLLVNFKKIKKTKERIFKEFLKKKIKLQVHYIPVNMQPYYKKKFSFSKKKFKNSIKFYNQEISMPIYYDLNFKQLKYIQKVSKQVFNIK